MDATQLCVVCVFGGLFVGLVLGVWLTALSFESPASSDAQTTFEARKASQLRSFEERHQELLKLARRESTTRFDEHV